MHELGVTLVAVATPQGRGGVGCVRISGPDAADVAKRLFRASREVGDARGSRPRFGRFLGRDGSELDHGYLVLFPPENAFTGEPTAELWPHGSPAVLAEMVAAAVEAGAAPAGPGEFTYRALRNGRLDLARAEAVRDLVAARTLYQARVAFAQVEGALSRRLRPLREKLADLITRGEAAVEFVEESETDLPAGVLEAAIAESRRECREMLAGFGRGRMVREGAAVAITGLPNVGKSSLFNRLLERDRAIVAEIPGTTRDTLEEEIDLEGVPVRLVDSAGIRPAGDPVESEGIRRARVAEREADLVLFVLDGSRETVDEERAVLAEGGAERSRSLVIVNKVDLPGVAQRPLPCPGALRVSAKTGHGLDGLREVVRQRLLGTSPLEDPILTDARHADAIGRALASLERAASASEAGMSEEIVLEDLRDAMRSIGTITGEFTTEDLYDRIFSTFCIGK
jgi:tRNA modification GTPase